MRTTTSARRSAHDCTSVAYDASSGAVALDVVSADRARCFSDGEADMWGKDEGVGYAVA